MLKKLNIYVVIVAIFVMCFNVLSIQQIIAAQNGMSISNSASEVVEGSTISFFVRFDSNVSSIMLSDGDVILRGFSGTKSVVKTSNNTYTINVSNVRSTDSSSKYIIINEGVGFIQGVGMTGSVNSPSFSITKKSNPVNPSPVNPIPKPEEPKNDEPTTPSTPGNTSNKTDVIISNKNNSSSSSNANYNVANNVNNNNNENEVKNDESEDKQEDTTKVIKENPNTGKIR